MRIKRKLPNEGNALISCNNKNTTVNGGTSKSCLFKKQCNVLPYKSNVLFRGSKPILVQRASFMPGILDVPPTSGNGGGLHKPFQRPMTKRRAYDQHAEKALTMATLGGKKRHNGMQNILARAKKPLHFKLPTTTTNETNGSDTENETDEEEEKLLKAPTQPYEPLIVWKSPHQGGELKGLPTQAATVVRVDEYGIEQKIIIQKPASLENYATQSVIVPEPIGKWLRPHQREGVLFMYECVMGLKGFNGQGCILADDMGLGKTLQSVALIVTLLRTGITAKSKEPTAKRVIVVCPCSLVKQWNREFEKWLGEGQVKVLAIAEADRKTVEKNLDCFVRTRMFNVLVVSYECLRSHAGRLNKHADCCDLLVCDEAHRLKNADNLTSKALNSLPVRRRVLLTGTPMQNDLQEFFAMVDFTNPFILGKPEQFRRNYEGPILRGREPDSTQKQKERMVASQTQLTEITAEFILRRNNTINAKHLPPKLVQVVCINLTDIQKDMYQHLVDSKDTQHILDGKQVNCLASIQLLMKLSNHPSLVVDDDQSYTTKSTIGKRAAATKQIKYNDDDDDKPTTAAPGADGIAKFLPYNNNNGNRGNSGPVHPEWSGKMYVLYKLMKEMRIPGNGNDKIVIISNYTQTLDLIGRMCKENTWRFCRLDGSVSMKKRQAMVEEFNDPCSTLIAFLLSSKAGGCGLNLIGANRLVLFDPDWNPAVDKQAAARCWRDGQQKRCFTYRFLATGTVEEKIFQRQLAKEGLQNVVDDKEQVNTLSTKDLRNLFKLRTGTPSDTHDKLKCTRCSIMEDMAEMREVQVLPKKLEACRTLLNEMVNREEATPFLKPMDPTSFNRTVEEYEKLVKQPMDFDTIRKKLDQPQGQPNTYASISGFSKDVNRIFSNVVKVWNDEEEITMFAKQLQIWWLGRWTELVPTLMQMKPDGEDEHEDEPVDDPIEEEILKRSAHNPHNIRSDHYQPQIGMPDDENMRDWSHHHLTDSCDDPVFRSAMRGTNLISFVFGLETDKFLIEEKEEAVAFMALQNQNSSMGHMEECDSDSESENNSVADDNVVSFEEAQSEKKGAKRVKMDITDRQKEEMDSSEEEDDDDDDGADLKDFIDDDDKGDDSDSVVSIQENNDCVPSSDSIDAESDKDDEVDVFCDGVIDCGMDDEQLIDIASKRCVDLGDSDNENKSPTEIGVEDECDSSHIKSCHATPSLQKNSPTTNITETFRCTSQQLVENTLCSSHKTNKGAPGSTCESDDIVPTNAAVEAKKALKADVLESFSEVMAEIAFSQEMKSPSGKAPKTKSAGPNKWSCPSCTFLNSNRKRKCVMCETKKQDITGSVS